MKNYCPLPERLSISYRNALQEINKNRSQTAHNRMDGEHPINIRGRVQRPRERQENVNEEDRELE